MRLRDPRTIHGRFVPEGRRQGREDLPEAPCKGVRLVDVTLGRRHVRVAGFALDLEGRIAADRSPGQAGVAEIVERDPSPGFVVCEEVRTGHAGQLTARPRGRRGRPPTRRSGVDEEWSAIITSASRSASAQTVSPATIASLRSAETANHRTFAVRYPAKSASFASVSGPSPRTENPKRRVRAKVARHARGLSSAQLRVWRSCRISPFGGDYGQIL